MKKTGRNDPCPCGSGKKFKKCCESTMIGGRFMATKVDTGSAPQIRKTANLTSLFQARLAETPKKPMPPQEQQTTPAQAQEMKSEKTED
jgi:hypothetical protein